MDNEQLKQQVRAHWGADPCGSQTTAAERFTRQYFDGIEEFRYRTEPEIFSFAQFTRHHGQKMLEVGVGAGSDFLQWVRAGAKAHGVDLTEQAIEHVKHRLAVYGLQAEEVRTADAENLPYADETFDLVYSWGVIHHTPDTAQALAEIVRVARIGGTIKVMIYNRHSLFAIYRWLFSGLLRGRFKSIGWVIYHHQESIGTKAYTLREWRDMLRKLPVKIIALRAPASYYDLLLDKPWFMRWPAYLAACVLGMNRCGWYMTAEVEKTGRLG